MVAFLITTGGLRAEGKAADSPKIQMEMAEPYVSPTNGLGSWIWEEKTLDNQTCQLWKTFEIPKNGRVTKARLVMTVDNEFTLYLDGRELGPVVDAGPACFGHQLLQWIVFCRDAFGHAGGAGGRARH